MTRVITEEIQGCFDSMNGGWPVLKVSLADQIVEKGLGGFYEEMKARCKNDLYSHQVNDICFLLSGIKALDQSVLESNVSPLVRPLGELNKLHGEVSIIDSNLKGAQQELVLSLNGFRPTLISWRDWKRAKESSPDFWNRMGLESAMNFEKDVLVNHACDEGDFFSFDDFKRSRKYYEALFLDIKRHMEDSYLRGDLSCSVFDFYEALEDLSIKSCEVDRLSSLFEEKMDMYSKFRERYSSQRAEVVNMFEGMSLSAKWAWFWINQP